MNAIMKSREVKDRYNTYKYNAVVESNLERNCDRFLKNFISSVHRTHRKRLDISDDDELYYQYSDFLLQLEQKFARLERDKRKMTLISNVFDSESLLTSIRNSFMLIYNDNAFMVA